MGTSETRDLPAGLDGIRRRFEEWRHTRSIGSRIPDRLWASAAIAAGRYGISRTANVLGVNYATLKKHIPPQTAAATSVSEEGAAATFLELTHPAFGGPCECTLELEDAAGATMRIHLKVAAPPDLAALCRSFWNPAS
jgi:hypothetical protein